MPQYIAYCRKSTDEKDRQVLSIEAQITELKEYAKRERIEIVDVLIESRTAKEPGRPIFGQLLKRIQSGEANAILSWHPDRLARNSVDGGQIIYLVDTGKILDLKFPSFWFENTPQGKFMLNIAFGQSKYYVDNLSENVKRGNRQKLRNGVWPNKAPLGYKNIVETKTIEIDPEKAKVVRKAFELFAEGKSSFTQVGKLMQKGGITSYSGKSIKIDQITRMLKKKFYIGILEFNGEEFKASHPTFISKQLYDRVQENIDRISRPREVNHDFAFSGLMRCGECGASITAEQHIKHYKRTDRIVKYIYYRCTKRIKPCSQPYIEEKSLFTQLKDEVSLCALPTSWKSDWKSRLQQDKILARQSKDQTLTALRAEIELFETKLNLLLDGYLDGTIEPDTYKTKKNQLFQDKLKLEGQISKTEDEGCSWFEPFSKFVDSAIQAQKIARKDSADDEFHSFIQNIGSNFFLKDKKLQITCRKPFASLRARSGRAGMRPGQCPKSQMVAEPGLEPGIFASRGRRPTIRRLGNTGIFYYVEAKLAQVSASTPRSRPRKSPANRRSPRHILLRQGARGGPGYVPIPPPLLPVSGSPRSETRRHCIFV